MATAPHALPLRPLSVDLGSATCGVVAGVVREDVLTIPLARPLDVDPADLAGTAEAILGLLDAHGADALILEVGRLFDAGTPQATIATANALATCREIIGGLALECRRRGIPVHRIPRRSWSCRLVPGVKGGVSNADAARAALEGLDEASRAHFAHDPRQHMRDALGAMRGWYLREAEEAAKVERARERVERPRAPRGPQPYVAPTGDRKAAKNAADLRRWHAKQGAAIATARAAAGCVCPKKHRRTCPLWVPLATKRASAEVKDGRGERVASEPGAESVAQK